MGHMTCALCGYDRVLEGPICQKCVREADTDTLEGAILVIFQGASTNLDDCTGWSEVVADLLRPFILGDKRHKHELRPYADACGLYCSRCNECWEYDEENGVQPQPNGPCMPNDRSPHEEGPVRR